MTSEIAKPADLLGAEDAGNDWKLAPRSHAEKLRPEAAALRRVLEHSVIREIMSRYRRADQLASSYQDSYKKLGRAEIYLATAAAVLGAIVLTMTDTSGATESLASVRPALLVLQVLCAGGVAAIKYYASVSKPFIGWQKQRSIAETARIELFETVAGMTERTWENEEQENDYPLLPLQLEYFVRYQLGVQLKYYEGRGAQHAAAAKRFVGVGAAITFVATVAGAIVAAGSGIGDTLSVAAVAALLTPILLTAQTGLSRLNQDERNAARYEITLGHLRKRSADLSDVRRLALEGNTDAVHEFIRRNGEVLSVEHSEWIAQQADAGQPDGNAEDANNGNA
ncbi:MAG: hypothetical protein AAGE85_06570 [Pseudomonadota bacterium]